MQATQSGSTHLDYNDCGYIQLINSPSSLNSLPELVIISFLTNYNFVFCLSLSLFT